MNGIFTVGCSFVRDCVRVAFDLDLDRRRNDSK